MPARTPSPSPEPPLPIWNSFLKVCYPLGVASLNGVPGEWVESPSSSQDMLLLYLHGGGYFACSAETHRPITAFFAMHGFRVFAPNYRLAPENRFPAAVDDAVAAYRGLLADGP